MKLTHATIASFFDWFYLKQAQKYGGDTSLNELRVMARCYKAYSSAEQVSITMLSKSLDIPTSTVHRAVTSLIDKGWLVDRRHPDDGRRRIIELSKQGVSGGLWDAAIEFLEQSSASSED